MKAQIHKYYHIFLVTEHLLALAPFRRVYSSYVSAITLQDSITNKRSYYMLVYIGGVRVVAVITLVVRLFHVRGEKTHVGNHSFHDRRTQK